jgi:hypothetical protein
MTEEAAKKMPHLRVAIVASTVAAAHAALQKPQKCSIAARSIAQAEYLYCRIYYCAEKQKEAAKVKATYNSD